MPASFPALRSCVSIGSRWRLVQAGILLTACLAQGADLRQDLCQRQLEQGQRLFHQQQYSEAAAQMRSVLQRCSGLVEARLLLGRCLLDLGSAQDAATELELAMELDPANGEIVRTLALALSRLGRFTEAAGVCRHLLANPRISATEREALAHALEVHAGLEELSQRDQPQDHRWNLGPLINSSFNDYMPTVTVDGRRLFFTSDRPGGVGDCPPGQRCREDFWQSEWGDDGWKACRNAGPPLNTPRSEGSASFTALGTVLYFTACDRSEGLGDCDIYRCSSGADGWGPPRNLGAPVNSSFWESQPAISADGCLLIFSSDRPGGFGQTDLWSSRLENGMWSEPVNLGAAINSPGRDETPFLHAGGKTLYYSSSGKPGFGDMDLFCARASGKGWTDPLNLGRPINGSGPDLGLVVPGEGRLGYYASPVAGGVELDLFGCRLPADCRPEEAFLLRGCVVDEESGAGLKARVRADGLLQAIEVPMQWSSELGAFGLVLAPGPILVSASAPGHFFTSRLLQHSESWSDSLLQLSLRPIRVGARAVLDNLLFDFNLASLKDESRPVLQAAFELLEENPGLVVELQGHTDAVGSPEYNLGLSSRRAQSVRDWLIAAGTDPERLQARGYGETVPVADNDSEAGRRLNRRTEILVLSF
ncbi:MAG: PD40 domain-containing protein [Candidatus Delongbacteria bacterium]|nr:PD40 domain-containing protein [Candidatus Delongbacteria bacterium]